MGSLNSNYGEVSGIAHKVALKKLSIHRIARYSKLINMHNKAAWI
jgi:hypothetical protein